MITSIYATKKQMTQTWSKSGKRMPVTIALVDDHIVTQIKTKDKDGYDALQLGFGKRSSKNVTKPVRQHIKKATEVSVRHLKEVAISDLEAVNELKLGSTIIVSQVLKVGDKVQVQGMSKGKGFAGGMKRHGFRGGPKTHGQSDRGRAPGSIGQGTDPGRVWKGKRMAGHLGDTPITISNLVVVKLDEATGEIWIKGLVPGAIGKTIKITKQGETNFEGLLETNVSEQVNEEKVITESDNREKLTEGTQV